jgi:hypothetical protein
MTHEWSGVSEKKEESVKLGDQGVKFGLHSEFLA